MKLELILLVLLCINVAYANTYDEIENVALDLNQTVNNTLDLIYEVDSYVEITTRYSFKKYPVGLSNFWITRVGDCTDKAKLKTYMLRKLGVRTRLVYGIAHDGNGWVRHDWYEFNINGTWEEIESEMFYGLKKYGRGRW